MAHNKYPCSQAQLITIADMAWDAFLVNIGDFANYYPKYNTKFYELRIQEIQLVRNSKNRRILNNAITDAKNKMCEAKRIMLFNFRLLKEYVRDSERKELVSLLVKPALYRKATNNNWSACNVITNNIIQMFKEGNLLAENNIDMKTGFAGECLLSAGNFQEAYLHFQSQLKNAETEGYLYMIACNKVYDELTKMLRHAKLIYYKNPAMLAQFCFDGILKKEKAKKKPAKANINPKTNAIPVCNEQVKPEKKNAFAFITRVASMF